LALLARDLVVKDRREYFWPTTNQYLKRLLPETARHAISQEKKDFPSNQGKTMSTIGVDAHTYALAHSRTYSTCLNRCRGDTTEAKRLAAYYMRDWYVVEDAPRA
jgi:hypothetical protein